MVAVSKLCCPTCWDFLDVLRRDEGDPGHFRARGRHTTVYPVELPQWLPPRVCLEMVNRFRSHLRNQLAYMVSRQKSPVKLNFRQHSRTHSVESDSSFNTTSSKGDESEVLVGVDFIAMDSKSA
jgi:hypothetical protein